jgi:hypothetical protein
MPTDRDRLPPEAGADTNAEGKNPRRADSGGHRTAAGSDYGDYVPDRGQPRHNDDRDAQDDDGPPMGDYYAGGGDLEHVAGTPVKPAQPPASPGDQGTRANEKNDKRRREEHQAADDEERIAEANRNKSFDTTHVHTGTTPR